MAGLYLNPPDNALILGVKKHADYLFAGHAQKNPAASSKHAKDMNMLASALDIAPKVTRQKYVIRQRHHELLEFLKRIEEIVAGDLEIHLVADNAAMRAHPKIQAWIASQSRWFFHVIQTPDTPNTLNTWLSLVEHILQTVGNGDHREQAVSGKEICRRIALFIAAYDKKIRPFLWANPTKDAFQ